MTQQTLREKIQHEMEISVYGFYCRRCGGGGANGQDKCELCNGTGIVDWNYDIATKEIIKRVIEWVEDQAEKENHNVDIDILISHLKEEV